MCPKMLSLDPPMEEWTRRMADTAPSAVGALGEAARGAGLSDGELYLLLALTSARFVSHQGPLVGHGTFNGGPMWRAHALLTEPYRELAWLHTAVYVADLLRHPNYGPFVMLQMEPLDDSASPSAAAGALAAAVESNHQALAAEHRLVGLLPVLGPAIRWPLLELGVRQMPDNEHKVLMVWRAVQLLDDAQAWQWAEPLLRAAIQYLANRVDTQLADGLPRGARELGPVVGWVDDRAARAWADQLVEAPYGEEPTLIMRAGREVSTATLARAMALAGSHLLMRSGWDAHAVTGLHCLLDLIYADATPQALRQWAWRLALSGQRTRRQKESAVRARWHGALASGRSSAALADMGAALSADAEGRAAEALAAGYLNGGGDGTALARVLMQQAMETAGPFDAIHNVKMLVGLYQQYRSGGPDAWVHLVAGAGAVARSVGEDPDGRDRVLDQWRSRAAGR